MRANSAGLLVIQVIAYEPQKASRTAHLGLWTGLVHLILVSSGPVAIESELLEEHVEQ